MKYLIKYNTLKLNAEITEKNLLKEIKRLINDKEELKTSNKE